MLCRLFQWHRRHNELEGTDFSNLAQELCGDASAAFSDVRLRWFDDRMFHAHSFTTVEARGDYCYPVNLGTLG